MEQTGLHLNVRIFESYDSKINNIKSLKKTNNIFITDSKYLYINKYDYNIVQYPKHSDFDELKETIFCQVEFDNNKFKLISPIKKDNSPSKHNITILKNKLWYTINRYKTKNKNEKEIKEDNENNENEDYYICENDIIKLGNIMYIVRKIHIQNNNKEEEQKNNDKNNNIYDIHNINKRMTNIKFHTSYEIDNFDNSYFCKHIINDKNKKEKIINYENSNKNAQKVKKYIFKIRKCKECNKVYPLRYKSTENNEIIDFTKIEEPIDKDYMILESFEEIEDDSDIPYKTNIYIIELTEEEQEIKIGRLEGNDLIDSNLSISRNHAILIYNKKEGKILLKNLSDKGTFILIKNELTISDKKEIYLQVGKAHLKAKIIGKEEFDNLKKKDEDEEELNKKKELEKNKEKEELNHQKENNLYGNDNK